MKCFLLIGFLAVAALARDPNGIRPRPNDADYPAHERSDDAKIGAAVLSAEQVRSSFATDLNKGGYIVVEVAFYPEPGKDIDLSLSDFSLKIGSDLSMVRPVKGSDIAYIMQDKRDPHKVPSRASDITLYPTATIGYETGPSYDPNTGQQRRQGGVYGGGGVGVGVGGAGNPNNPPPPRPASTDRDRSTMGRELEDKSLPEGKTSRAVAGYLYFPRPSSKVKNGLYELTYYGVNGNTKLSVPPPPK
jgi:hypothetical protein